MGMEKAKIRSGSKVFWLLSYFMVLNFTVMYTIAQLSLDAPDVPAVGVLIALAMMLYIAIYGIISFKIGSYICRLFEYEYEVLFDTVVLGIPDLICYFVFCFYSYNVVDGNVEKSFLCGGCEMGFSGRDALTNVAGALMIFFPIMFFIKLSGREGYMDSYDKKHAREYRNLMSQMAFLSKFASSGAVSRLQDNLAENEDFQNSKDLHKREMRVLRVITILVIFLALNLALIYIINYQLGK